MAAVRSHRPSLLLQFGLASLVPIVLLGVVLALHARSQVRARAIADARQVAQFAAGSIRVHMSDASLAAGRLTAAEQQRVGRAVAVLHAAGAARVKVFDRRGTIVYSDAPELIGRRYSTGELDEALAGGMPSHVSDLTDAEDTAERRHGQLLEVYVPLRSEGGAVVGASEIYLPYSPIAAGVSQDVRTTAALILAGLCGLWLALFPIVRRLAARLRDQARENEALTLHDRLTGLPNRTLFMDRVEVAIAAAGRRGGNVGVMFIDLDGFKDVNDTLGHGIGDRLLEVHAERIRGALRPGDTVARLGGDEFGVVVPDVDGVDGVVALAQRLDTVLSVPVVLEGIPIEVRGSIGVAYHPEHGDDLETLMRHADVAMYVAKHSKSRYAIYDREQDVNSTARLALIAELRGAIERSELVPYYQPKADLATGEVRSLEALVRWEHPWRGLLAPAEFVPLAEHTGLIGPMTLHVIDRALADAARWRRDGIDLSIAVNLSPRNLGDRLFPGHVEELLDRHGLPGDALQLEVTESAVLSDSAAAAEVLAALSAMGIRIAVDDFGTGYSSLRSLAQLPIDEIKIDRSFVMRMADDSRQAAIVRSTVELGRNLGVHVVAEGVESQRDWDVLAAMGCDTAQGYFLTPPLPRVELGRWLASRTSAAAEAA